MGHKVKLPYFQVPNSIFDNRELNLKSLEKLVLIYICRCSNQGAVAYPSYNTIADRCEISRPSAIKAVNSLERKGCIQITKRPQDNSVYDTNVYEITLSPGKADLLPPSKGDLPGVVNGDDRDSKRGLPNKELLDKELLDKDISSIIELYHSNCPSFPRVLKLTDNRKRTIKARLKKYSLEQLEEAFKKAEASAFLSGRSGKWAGCNLDWLLNENNLLKVLEGNYQNRGAESNNGSYQTERKDESYYREGAEGFFEN